jgi:hypothetical protein
MGVKKPSKEFEFNTDMDSAKENQRVENYFIRMDHARKNYLPG